MKTGNRQAGIESGFQAKLFALAILLLGTLAAPSFAASPCAIIGDVSLHWEGFDDGVATPENPQNNDYWRLEIDRMENTLALGDPDERRARCGVYLLLSPDSDINTARGWWLGVYMGAFPGVDGGTKDGPNRFRSGGPCDHLLPGDYCTDIVLAGPGGADLSACDDRHPRVIVRGQSGGCEYVQFPNVGAGEYYAYVLTGDWQARNDPIVLYDARRVPGTFKIGGSSDFLVDPLMNPRVDPMVRPVTNSPYAPGAVTVYPEGPPEDDHGDTPGDATVVSENSVTAGYIFEGGDLDYFRIDLNRSGTLTVGTERHVATVGTLIGPGGTIATKDDGGELFNFRIVEKVEAGTHYVEVRGSNSEVAGPYFLNVSFVADTEDPVVNPPVVNPPDDDHGNSIGYATIVSEDSVTGGEIEEEGDLDYFRIDLNRSGTLTMRTDSPIDTVGTLTRPGGQIATDDDSGEGYNFRIVAEVEAGTHYVIVSGYDSSVVGSYTLVISFAADDNELIGSATTTHILPLVTSASRVGQQSVVRVINRSDRAGTVRILAIDDGANPVGPITLSIAANATRSFKSEDLEDGDATKGLSGGVGPGWGDWWLELESDLDIFALTYIRTQDGLLVSMHDVAPESRGVYHVPTFNPGSNEEQRSLLRLINSNDRAVDVTIDGLDDNGDGAPQGRVTLSLPANSSTTITAQELEGGGGELRGRFGDGAGKWQLFVTSSGPIQVMSLMDMPTGNLVNLSTFGGAPR